MDAFALAPLLVLLWILDAEQGLVFQICNQTPFRFHSLSDPRILNAEQPLVVGANAMDSVGLDTGAFVGA